MAFKILLIQIGLWLTSGVFLNVCSLSGLNLNQNLELFLLLNKCWLFIHSKSKILRF